MPRVIDYATVLQRLTGQGLVCRYPSSGAFGFNSPEAMGVEGWIGPPDPTIRPEVAGRTRAFDPPYEENLSLELEREVRSGGLWPAWLMPMSQWAYELEYGGRGWLEELIRVAQLDPSNFARRHDGSAIEFTRGEEPLLGAFVRGLLQELGNSDFMLAFPGRPVLCMVHHHKQLWWMRPCPAAAPSA